MHAQEGRPGPAGAPPTGLRRWVPILDWGRRYDRDNAVGDLVAAAIVTMMLIPQSLAYAMLAGLPPEVGLYASILPLVVYAVFGTSRALAVGPVAVVSLMTAEAVGAIAVPGSAEYTTVALTLALLTGLILLAMGALRLGFLANFLSHPVVSGFITAAGLLIAASQLKDLLGIPVTGTTLPDLLPSLWAGLPAINPATAAIGIGTLTFLIWARRRLRPLMLRLGAPWRLADVVARAGPVATLLATILLVRLFDLDAAGVAVVGAVPQALPPLTVPVFDLGLWRDLAAAALLIAVVGFVESVSVAQTLAAKKRQRILPDQELVALGGANVAAAFTAGYPVTGGFARSVVNDDAGARTPAAGAFTAIGIAAATLTLTPFLFHLPKATLAATIIVAVLSLVDFGMLRRTWVYSKADFAAVAVTIIVTLGAGVEIGVSAGAGLSILLYLIRTSRPHMAVVGLVPGTQHFRNVLRHRVEISPTVLGLRVDESLYFANARDLEDRIVAFMAEQPALRHVVLQCSAINEIDASALESLESIDRRLKGAGIAFHLSEVKGPVMDRLKRTDFLDHLSGQVHLSHFGAIAALDPQAVAAAGQGGPA